MTLGLIVSAVVLVTAVVIAILGYLIDRSAEV